MSRNKLFVLGAIVLVVGSLALVGALNVLAENAATVTTDKGLYHTGETVLITGKGMDSNENVQVNIYRGPLQSPRKDLVQGNLVASDVDGNFSDSYIIPLDSQPGLYAIEAIGQVSGKTATATFIDPPSTNFSLSGFGANQTGNGSLNLGWTGGNLGNTWAEGEWVPYKLVITNVQTNYPGLAGLPDIVLSYDFTGNGGARFIDLIRDVQIGTTDLSNTQAWPDNSGNAYPTTNRAQLETAQNSTDEHVWSSGGFQLLNVPSQLNRSLTLGTPGVSDSRLTLTVRRADLVNKGLSNASTIVIYFQLHESRTFVWNHGLEAQYSASSPVNNWGGYIYDGWTDTRNGSGYVPGSSGHVHSETSGIGSLDVPIPIPPAPAGIISGYKWQDDNGNGVKDGSEIFLANWPIQISINTLPNITFQANTTTDSSGNYSFNGLTAGSWVITEDNDLHNAGYHQSYPTLLSSVGVGTGIPVNVNGVAPVGWSVGLTDTTVSQSGLNFGNFLNNPATTLTTKSVSATKVEAGTDVTITVTETNTGDVSLSNVNVTGTGCTNWTPSNLATLAVGASQDFTCTFTANSTTDWSATGHGTDPVGNPAPDTNETTSGTVTVIHPATTLTTKSVTPGTTVEAGTLVTVVVTETNTGDDTLSNVYVDGTGCTSWTPASVPTLASNASQDFTCSYTPTISGSWSAAAHATDSLGNAAPSEGESTSGDVTVLNPATVLSLVSVTPSTTVEAGTEVTVTVKETNSGDADLTNVSVTGSPCANWTGGASTLAAGADTTFSCTFTANDTTSWSADGHGTDVLNNAAPSTNEHQEGSVTVIHPATELTLKSITGNGTVEKGSSVTIVVTETNIGDDTLSGVNVTGTGCDTWTGGVSTLNPNDSTDFTCSYTPSVSGNWSATGHGTDSLNNPAPDTNETVNGTVTLVDLKISISSNSVNKVGDAHTFTVTVEKDLGDGNGFFAAEGETVTVGVTAPGSLTGTGSCETGVTDSNGQCTIVVNSSAPGVGTVSASTTVSVGGVDVTRSLGDGLSGDSAKATKTWVDASISIGTSGTNEVGNSHTFTVSVGKNEGAGWVGASGVVVTPSSTGVGSITDETCTAGTVNGQCTITVNSDVPGSATVNASATVIVGGVSIDVATDGYGAYQISNVKTWVDGSLVLSPLTATNAVGQNHVITAHVTKNDGTGVADMAGATVNFAITGDATFVGSDSCVTAANGTCTVTINSSTVGSNTVNATTTFMVGGVSLTRTSGDGLHGDSVDAQKDYVNARISIAPQSSTNEVNDDHTFVVTVEQNDGSGWKPVAEGTLANAIVSPSTTLDVSDCNDGVDVNGQCNVVVNSSAAGVFTITARSTVVVNGVEFKLQTNGVGENSGSATKTYVDAKISLDPLTATNNITDPHTVTVTVMKDPGTGIVAAAGEHVDFTLTDAGGAVSVLDADASTCDDAGANTDSNGQCTIVFVSATPGSVTTHATVTLTVGGVSLARATDGTHGSTGDAVKTYVAGSLDITKTLDVSQYPTAGLGNVDGTFTVTVTGPSYPDGQDVSFTMVDGVITSTNPVHLEPLIPGAYTVSETDPGIAWTVTGGGNVDVVANQNSSSEVTNALKKPHTTISVTSDTQETQPGENVILTVSDTNDGQVDLNNPTVVLTYGSTTETLSDVATADCTAATESGTVDGVMNVGETWTWTCTILISSNTTFNVDGHGTDSFGTDITPSNGVTSEHGSLDVKVIGTTRTLGFWQTHTTFTSYVLANQFDANGLQVGDHAAHKGGSGVNGSLDQAQLFGGFYAPMAKTTDGKKRTQSDQARINLLQQLLAAKLNCAAFGCSTTIQNLINKADLDYAAGVKNNILADSGALDAFNNSGDSGAIPSGLPATGKATPSLSKSTANIGFWDLP